jgi:hypothetical protein
MVRASPTVRRKRISGVRFGLEMTGAGKNLAQQPDAFWSRHPRRRKFGPEWRCRGLTRACRPTPPPGPAHQWYLGQTLQIASPSRPQPCRYTAPLPPLLLSSVCFPRLASLLWHVVGILCPHFSAAWPPHLIGVGLILGHLLPRPRGVRPFA